MADLYKILSVSRSATQAEIKQAFRNLALRCHPDVAGGDAVAFQRVSTAYNTLSNEVSRRAYDQTIGNGNRRVSYPGSGSGSKTDYRSVPPRSPRSRGTTVSPEHFDMNAWNAAHYGDNALAQPSVVQRNSWMNMKGNQHASYYARKAKERFIKSQEAASQQASNAKPPSNECTVS